MTLKESNLTRDLMTHYQFLQLVRMWCAYGCRQMRIRRERSGPFAHVVRKWEILVICVTGAQMG